MAGGPERIQFSGIISGVVQLVQRNRTQPGVCTAVNPGELIGSPQSGATAMWQSFISAALT